MDKRTLFAVVLSVIVISVGFFLQGIMAPPKKPAPQAPLVQSAQATPSVGGNPSAPTEPSAPGSIQPSDADSAGLAEGTATYRSNLLDVTLTDRGGAIQSFELLKHLDGGKPLEMINSGSTGLTAFNLSFGPYDAAPVSALFHFTQVDPNTFQFTRQFVAPGGVPFTLTKTYLFHPDSYMMELKVDIANSVNQYPNLVSGGYAYTLQVGPQIGPKFEKLGNRGEYRNYYYYAEGKRKTFGVPARGAKTLDERVSWAAIVGKYFTVIGIPDATQYALTYSSKPIAGLVDTSEMYFSRPPIASAKSTDLFQFYLGPKDPGVLASFDDPSKNAFGTSGLNLQAVIDTSTPLLGWLVVILDYCLKFFYSLVPNWGVAIILLTIVIKVILFPITRKSYESTSKMQALSPKLKELQAKYKNNTQKLNQEMAALYKREGVSPLGGCLPLLLQMPVFFALYGLLNTEFQLRGAMFIPGWITDLSAPESVYHFTNFVIPILGWTDIRVLPLIYVGSQLLSGKIMQTPDAGANRNMMMMTYLMPLIFFFVLYNAPSGLIVYWTVTNLLTVAQQAYMNSRRRRKQGLVPARKG